MVKAKRGHATHYWLSERDKMALIPSTEPPNHRILVAPPSPKRLPHLMMLVQSKAPPMPTSTTARSTCRRPDGMAGEVPACHPEAGSPLHSYPGT